MDEEAAGRRGRRVIARTAAFASALIISCAADVVSDTQQALAAGDFTRAEEVVRANRMSRGVTPDLLEAASWIARADLAARRLDAANAQAKDILALYREAMRGRSVDSDARLATAVGAAIEVEAQSMADRGQRAAALAFLHREFTAFSGTSIAARIRKNINVLSLEGRAAPALDVAQSIGPKAPTLAALHGRPVLLFFWAHWCGDCKGDEPTIAKLAREYQARGLVVIGPTQLYGYTPQNETASPDEELAWTRRVFDRFYSDIPGIIVPVSSANFRTYGASTTPTIVVIDRAGVVRLYHPGAMTEAELRPVLERVTAGKQ